MYLIMAVNRFTRINILLFAVISTARQVSIALINILGVFSVTAKYLI
jgi:hypothetical protein